MQGHHQRLYSHPELTSTANRLVAHLEQRLLPSSTTPSVSELLDLLLDDHGLAILLHSALRAENRGYGGD